MKHLNVLIGEIGGNIPQPGWVVFSPVGLKPPNLLGFDPMREFVTAGSGDQIMTEVVAMRLGEKIKQHPGNPAPFQ